MPSGRPAFRPDIEGLRGVAILLVVLFHAGVAGFDGGFVGVDVFFVLSGFFITAILVRELDDTGSVDVTAFWGKRALRLLPTLLLVLVATLAAVMFLYAPIDQPSIASNARAVALYSGNIEFARNDVNYFSAGENPLLHTWSLAVEEQFYLVWPLIILFGAVILARSSSLGTGDVRRRLLVGILIVGALSLFASVWLTASSQTWAFFGMPTRIWEFALGGALAMTLGESTDANRGVATALQTAGLGAIAIGVFTYDRGTPYPGLAATLPAFGAVALLVGGQRAPDGVITRALSAQPLQFLGRLSYAWYLWHWPLIGLGGVLNWEIGVWGKLAWSAAALVLAWLTYWFIEQPARNGGVLSRIPGPWIAPAALAASVATAVVAHSALSLARVRISKPDQRAFAMAREDRVAGECWATTLDDYRGPCVLGDRKASTVLVLLGDSHAQHWIAGLDRVGRERGWKILAMVKGGCPVPDMVVTGRRAKYFKECNRFREAMLQRIVAMRPNGVILSNWDHYVDPVWGIGPEQWRDGLRRTYRRLTSAGIRTVVIRGTPRTWFDVPMCLSRRAAGMPFAPPCVYDRTRALPRAAIAAQTDAARGLPIAFVDMNDQICTTAKCGVVQNGLVVFTDDNHLTARFSRAVSSVLGSRLDAALAALAATRYSAKQ